MRFLFVAEGYVALLLNIVFLAWRPTLVISVSLHREAAVDHALQKLRSALLASDKTSVLRITDELRRPFLEHEGPHSNFLAKTDQPGSKLRSLNSQCIFDDHLFSLTPTAKQELETELKESSLASSVAYVRRGGWWDCATEHTKCTCAGDVRLVDIDRNQFPGSAVVDAEAKGGSVQCIGATFGVKRPDTKPPWPSPEIAQCECKSRMEGRVDDSFHFVDGFHLEKRLNSKTVLQEAWIFLLRLLARTGHMPLGTGDRTYSGTENWSRRGSQKADTFGNTVVLERFWLVKYMREVVWYLAKGPRCLEWGNPEKPGQELMYSGLVPACTIKYDMQFDHIYWRGAGKHINGNVVHSDILSLPDVLATQGLQMDVIFATQVFEHLSDPFPAAQALYRATAPNGVVIVTAPQQAQFHQVPHDYFRYTKEGLKFMLVKAGFCVPNAFFIGGGDFVFDIARDAGLQVQDFALDEIEAAWQVGYDKVSDAAITIHVLAFKQPSPWCQNSTSGWQDLQRRGIGAA